jgi:pentatricopeptide repeat protein
MLKESFDMGLNTLLYTTVMRGYAIHGNLHGVQRMLDHMEAEFQNGNKGAQPSQYSWATLIDAHAQSGSKEAGKNAQECLYRMKQKSQV